MNDLSLVPPHDLDAEKGLLGAFLIDPSIVDGYSPRLSPDDFHSDANRRLFMAINTLQEEGIPVDLIVLLDRLRRSEEVDAVGGEAYIAEIMTTCHTVTNADNYAGIISDMSLRRKMLAISGKIQSGRIPSFF